MFTAANLASFVNYTCKITAKNRVSKIAAAKSEGTVTYVNLRTKGTGKFVEPDIMIGSSLVPLYFMGKFIKIKKRTINK